MANDDRTALDSSWQEGMYRIDEELDGKARPVAKPEPPPAVQPGGFSSEQPAKIETVAEGPGFWSKVWGGVTEVAPVVADAIGKGMAAKAAQAPVLVTQAQDPGQTLPGSPMLPKWALWAGGGVLLLLVVLLVRRLDD